MYFEYLDWGSFGRFSMVFEEVWGLATGFWEGFGSRIMYFLGTGAFLLDFEVKFGFRGGGLPRDGLSWFWFIDGMEVFTEVFGAQFRLCMYLDKLGHTENSSYLGRLFNYSWL